MIIEQKLLDIQARAKEIETKMNSGDISGDELTKLSKEYSQLNEILPLIDKYLQTQKGSLRTAAAAGPRNSGSI